jgi:NDP-sugar pyrophosphorylase family protein
MLRQVAAAVLLAAVVPARADDACSIQVGPSERFAQGQDLIVQPGERLTQVTALRGRVIVRGGAEIDEALSLAGDVVLEPGARVNGSVTSIGGNVVIHGNAWVREHAVSIGGSVERAPESWVGGSVVALAVQVGDGSLAQSIAQRLARCKIVQVHAGAAPESSGETL